MQIRPLNSREQTATRCDDFKCANRDSICITTTNLLAQGKYHDMRRVEKWLSAVLPPDPKDPIR